MPTTLTARQFNQDTSSAKRAASSGPVFITDRGEPSYVLLSMEDYRKLSGPPKSLAEALAHPESADIVFDPPKMTITFKDVEFD